MIKKLLLNKKGESLIEVLTSVLVLSLGIAAAATIIISGTNISKSNQNRLIATNLAREGVEYIRSLRDTNYLKFPSSPEFCWLALNSTEEADCSEDGSTYRMREGAYYAVAPLMTYSPLVYPQLSRIPLDLTDNSSDRIYNLCLDANGRYVANQILVNNPDCRTPSPFYRQVTIAEVGAGYDQVLVTSEVQWLEGSKLKKVIIQDELRNYKK